MSQEAEVHGLGKIESMRNSVSDTEILNDMTTRGRGELKVSIVRTPLFYTFVNASPNLLCSMLLYNRYSHFRANSPFVGTCGATSKSKRRT